MFQGLQMPIIKTSSIFGGFLPLYMEATPKSIWEVGVRPSQPVRSCKLGSEI